MVEENKVSVIIPTYNRSSYLKKAIQSVLEQTYTNVEIIVVDDASTDDTEEIIKSFNDKRITYIKNEKNMGSNFCRNAGLRKAIGVYIAFLDDDDYFSNKNKLKEQIKLFDRNKNLVFAGCGYYDESINTERFPNIRGDISQKLLVSFLNIETSTIMMKRSVLDKVGYLDENLPSEQNHDFFYRISKFGEFDYVNKIMVIKCAPPIQISSHPKKKLVGYILFHKKHFEDIKKLPLKHFLYINFKFIIVLLVFLTSLISKRNLKIVKIIDKKIGVKHYF